MQDNKQPIFFATIVAIIVGSRLYKQFNVEHLRFEKPVLAFIYAIAFITAMIILIKSWTQRKNRSAGNQ